MDAATFTKKEQLAIIAAVKETYGFGSSYASQRLGWSACVFFLSFLHPIFFVMGIFSVIVAALIVQQTLLTEYAKRGVCPIDNELKSVRPTGSSIHHHDSFNDSSYRPYSPSSRSFHSDSNSYHKPHW